VINKEKFVEAFIEGVNLGITDPEKKLTAQERESANKFKTLVGLLFESRQQTKQLLTRIEEIDSDMADANIQVKCRSCDEYYSLDYDVSEFSRDMSYCGGSPRCCL
jgi:hypothetical protein